jgi:hypothetical protein
VRGLVDHDSDLGRLEIQRTRPRCSHDIGMTLKRRRHQNRWAVVEQTVGFVEGDRREVVRCQNL